ncbi:sugar porter family MFS transporter [Prochlorococcus marinus]|uniref:sugar porter family MFS transporter n=1 Tax=Prochlorococcus marinus TaxID=1219 RepID=UPI0007B3F3A1|nr:sugar porter family MFS transporter [Prochlorococcus marinus]
MDSSNQLSDQRNKRRRLRFILQIAISAALGGFLFGYDTAVINGAVGAIGTAFTVSKETLGFAVASALLGSALGAFTSGWLSDRIGRRNSMLVAALMFLVGSLGSALAPTITILILWRVVGGLAVGFASVLAPAYIAEISPASMRGQLGSLQQLAIVIGIFLALLFDYVIVLFTSDQNPVSVIGPLAAWRWMFMSEIIPAALYAVLVIGIPESPRYLVQKGLTQLAKAVIEKTLHEPADQVIARIQSSLVNTHQGKLSELFDRNTILLPIIWTGVMLAIFQQFVGINVIFYYSSVLWQAVGFSAKDSLIVTVITSITNVVTTFIAIAFIDRLGRKPLLLAGSVVMAVNLGVMSWAFAGAPLVNGSPHLAGAGAIVALIAANLFVFAFGFSWGPVMWVMLGEMFNNRIRAVAIGLCAMVNWIANFLISDTFPGLLERSGPSLAYGLYSTAAAISFFLVLFFVRETKGKELEEMA